MVVEKDYDGVPLGTEMTKEFIDDMIERFRNQKKIHRKYVFQIILAVKEIVHNEPTMVEMKIPEGNTLTVCGDTHGMNSTPCLPNMHPLTHKSRSILRPPGNLQTQWLP
jgi:hypothetical protein